MHQGPNSVCYLTTDINNTATCLSYSHYCREWKHQTRNPDVSGDNYVYAEVSKSDWKEWNPVNINKYRNYDLIETGTVPAQYEVICLYVKSTIPIVVPFIPFWLGQQVLVACVYGMCMWRVYVACVCGVCMCPCTFLVKWSARPWRHLLEPLHPHPWHVLKYRCPPYIHIPGWVVSP